MASKYAPDSFDYYNVLPGQGDYFNPWLFILEKEVSKKVSF